MHSTNNCMRRYLENSIEDGSGFTYQHFAIAPLCEFAKLGNHLQHLYLVRNTITDKLQLWYCDIDVQYVNSYCHLNDQKGNILVDDVVEHAFTECITKQIIPFEFDDIEILLDYSIQLEDPCTYMAFLVSENAKTGLFLRHGVNIILNKYKWYDSLEKIGAEHLLAKEENKAFILNKMGDIVCSLGQYQFIRLIGEDTYLAEMDNCKLIKKFDGKVVAPIVKGQFVRLTNDSHYITHDHNGYAIFDFYGNVITGGYNTIKNSNDKYIVAEKNAEFYLLDLSGLVILKSKDFMIVTRAFWAK